MVRRLTRKQACKEVWESQPLQKEHKAHRQMERSPGSTSLSKCEQDVASDAYL